ncbi:trimeric LpxA-like protein [Aspergillus crustosus]
MFGPKVSLYSGTHPLDPDLRNGTSGPELGKEIHIGEDCWLAGNVTVLPGVTIGNGAVIGAGSVVTKVVTLTIQLTSIIDKLGYIGCPCVSPCCR